MKKHRRIITIALFPVLAVMFMVGFLLSTYGEKTVSTKKVAKKPQTTKPTNQPYDFEMEVISQNQELTIKNK
jgi:hypothetical protein